MPSRRRHTSAMAWASDALSSSSAGGRVRPGVNARCRCHVAWHGDPRARFAAAESTGERTGSCEMSETRSREESVARTTRPSQCRAEAARIPSSSSRAGAWSTSRGRSAAPRRWSASWCAPVATPARPVRSRQREARCRWGPDQKTASSRSHREMKIERPHCDGWVTDAASRTSRPLRVRAIRK